MDARIASSVPSADVSQLASRHGGRTSIGLDPVQRERDPPADLHPWIDAYALAIANGALRLVERGALRPANDGAATAVVVDAGVSSSLQGEDRDVLTVDEVAALLKISRNAVYDAAGRGEIPHRRIGKQIRFSRDGIMRWLAGSCEVAGKGHR